MDPNADWLSPRRLRRLRMFTAHSGRVESWFMTIFTPALLIQKLQRTRLLVHPILQTWGSLIASNKCLSMGNARPSTLAAFPYFIPLNEYSRFSIYLDDIYSGCPYKDNIKQTHRICSP